MIGIIAEYNPLHLGHIEMIKNIKEKFKDEIVVIMSGSIVQRGEFALIDKFSRAHSAVISGADLVIELDTQYSLESARGFARGAIETLNLFPTFDKLAFGVEKSFFQNLSYLNNNHVIPKNKIKYNIDDFTDIIKNKKQLDCLAKKEKSLRNIYTKFNSNEILAIEYINQLINISENKNFYIIPINRFGDDHSDLIGHDDKFRSASYIRKNINNKNINKYIPNCTLNDIKKIKKIINIDFFNKWFQVQLEMDYCSIKKALSLSPAFETGMDNRFLMKFNETESIEKACILSANKKHSISRYRRLFLSYLIGIQKNNINKKPSFIRPLASNKNGLTLLKNLKQNNVKIIDNINDFFNKSNSILEKEILRKNNLSYNLHSMLLKKQLNEYDFKKLKNTFFNFEIVKMEGSNE